MATRKPAPTTAVVNVGEFAAMLTDLMRTAGTDQTLPMINGVLLHTGAVNKQPVLKSPTKTARQAAAKPTSRSKPSPRRKVA